MSARSLLVVALTLSAVACRDDIEPFVPDEAAFDSLGRLTLSESNDRMPVWSSSGDAIYYKNDGLVGVDSGPGLLLRVTLADGRSEPVLPMIQSPAVAEKRWFLAPSSRPDGGALALAEVVDLWTPHQCNLAITTLQCSPTRTPEEAERPPLQRIAIRVRALDATSPLEDDPHLMVEVAGVEVDPGPPTTSIVATYPFQQLFAQSEAATFRPSWSPQGDRVAFSDGLRLQIWTVGDDTAMPVPNTEDGAWAAWSPDGEWLAFSRLERADSTGASCNYLGGFGNTVCVQERTEYTIGAMRLSLIRPDGTDLTELDEGAEPAWSPDGQTIYFTRDDRIWAIPAGGGTAQPVPDANGGREPAISPDGQFLAFAKLEGEDYNIWVVRLEP